MKWVCVLFVLMPMWTNGFSEPQNLTSPCTDKNHLFLAPGVLSAGGTNRACVSRFYPEGPARMVLSLLAEDVTASTAVRELPPGDGGCIDIAVPQKPNTKAKLAVKLWYPDAKCYWDKELSVLISSGRVVVVQMERARYRRGETLRARIIALKPDLTPAHGQIDEVWLEGPRGAWDGSRAAEWLRVRTRMGIAQVEYDLDEQAPAGRWTMRAKLADGSQGSVVFWVGDYELPPFQLSVRHAPRVLRTSERLVWTVCVRYPWTEAVEGMLVIRIRGAGGAGGTGGAGGARVGAARSSLRTVARLRAPRACHRHAAAARRVGLDLTDPPDVLVADFSFQEDGTRIWQNTTVVSQVVDHPVTLEFLRKMGAVISPGLPYKLKVKATRWDDKPAANERIKVCRSSEGFAPKLAQAANDTCHEAVTDDRGIARVTFTAVDDGSSFYNFQASLPSGEGARARLRLPARPAGAAHASLGPIKPDASSAKTFVPLYVSLRNVSRPLTVHFVVITRGGIIYRWGATTQCPLTSSSDYIPTTSRNTQCQYNYDTNAPNHILNPKDNDEGNSTSTTHVENYQTIAENYQSNVDFDQTSAETGKADGETREARSDDPDSLLDRHLLRVMLPIKVTHQMCPDSHLVAYFYYNGELVSASKQFEMDECFSNKVEATWLARQVSPGSMASLRVSTPGPALCALSVLDSACRWNQPPPTVKELVMTGLKRLMDSHRNLTEYEAGGACFKMSDVPELPTNSLEQTVTWLAAAGVRVAGGELTESRSCVSPPAPLINDVTVPRSDFSEAWLWRLTAVGTNGSSTVSARAPDSISRFEAAAVCLSRTGISVSPPAVLQVFREFFIHADGPRRLRRGDTTIIRYRIFNYLYEPLSVQIQIVPDARLSGPQAAPQTACVGARASVARRVQLSARAAGPARLALRAADQPHGDCAHNQDNFVPVSDEVIIPIMVDPEGVPVLEHKSIMLCGRGSPESSLSEVSWSWPPVQAVQGTETLSVWAMGDIKGPLLFDADGLVTLPRGCGEQNMARLALNLLALNQLAPDSPAAAAAKEHVSRGFTRQLQYVHPSGGFSAFGANDAVPSTWLTAFTLKYLRRAHQVLTPEQPLPPALERAERWLLSQQMENGCFRNEGQVFHRELRGGLTEEGEIASVALTAYVVSALAEGAASVRARSVRAALACLRALPPAAAAPAPVTAAAPAPATAPAPAPAAHTRVPSRVYARALLAYAFMHLRDYEEHLKKTNEASLLWDKKETIGAGLKEDEELRELMELLKIAKRTEDYVWWETSSLSTSVEATAYALMALSLCPVHLRCAADARAAVRWLQAHRTHAGGFLSTQDTLVALEALSKWSSVQPSTPPNLTVRLKSGGDLKKILIQPDMKVPEVTKITGKDHVDVSVEGVGCALVQATRSYNTLTPEKTQDKQLTVQATVHTDGAFNCDLNMTSCFCAAVIEVCVSWTGEFPAMAMVEVALPSGYGADASHLYAQLQIPDTLLRRVELSPTGGRATLYLSADAGAGAGAGAGADAGAGGHACARVHAVGPRARTKPAHVRVLDYYEPAVNDTQMYTIPEDCPPRISESTNDYHASDNLFNKARSLTDSGEILMTHEFSFEDIPEGIPLDDLGRDDVAYLTRDNEVTHARNNEDKNLIPDTTKTQNNHITANLREQNDDNKRANINHQTQVNKKSFSEIRTPIEEMKLRKNFRKDTRSRKGHSIPFIVNHPHFIQPRMYDYSNVYFGQDLSHQYPENIFYEFNPYARRLNEQNSGFNYYQEARSTPYGRVNINHHKQDFTRPFIADYERFNKETYSKSNLTEDNKKYLGPNTRINKYPNIDRGHSITYKNDKEFSVPIFVRNENVEQNHFVPDKTPDSIKMDFQTTTSTYATTRPDEIENFEKAEITESNQSSFRRNQTPNVSPIQLASNHHTTESNIPPNDLPGKDSTTNSTLNSLFLSLLEDPELLLENSEKTGVQSVKPSSPILDSQQNEESERLSDLSDGDSAKLYFNTSHKDSNLNVQPNKIPEKSSDQLVSFSDTNPSLSDIHLTKPNMRPNQKQEVITPQIPINPSSSHFNPNPSSLNPAPSQLNQPSSYQFNPSQSNMNPDAINYNPILSSPDSSYYNPSQSLFNLSPPYHNPSQSTFNPYASNFKPNPSNYNPIPSNNNPDQSHNFNPSNNNPSQFTSNLRPAHNPNLSNINPDQSNSNSPSRVYSSMSNPPPKSQKVASQLDNPNLAGFHVVDSEADLEVPTGLEGPVPAIALPPQNFVAVAPPPDFQTPFFVGGYPRHYPQPPRPQYPYFRDVHAG